MRKIVRRTTRTAALITIAGALATTAAIGMTVFDPAALAARG